MTAPAGDLLYGRNPIVETLKAGRRRVESIRIARGAQIEGSLAQLVTIADEKHVPMENVPRQELDRTGVNHQGVTALASPYPYADLTTILEGCEQAVSGALVLILDMLQDPQNLGTLLRSAEAVSVAGVLIPAHRSASVTPAVVRASAGASEHLLIARQNLAQAMRALKEAQFWIAGLDQAPSAKHYTEVSFTGRMGLVVGNEGTGLRRLVRDSCDFLVQIPMGGQISSLNAAVAGSIVLFTAHEQRNARSIDATPESW